MRTAKGLRPQARERGRESVLVLRADPLSLPSSAVGDWFTAGWRHRLVRRAALQFPVITSLLPPQLRVDAAFWSGVRDVATAREWKRWTKSSYVVLCYHRIAGLALPGQERMDVRPQALQAQLRLLKRLGWTHLSSAEVLRFHLDPDAVMPRRRFVLTADDGFAEAIAELADCGDHQPQVFVVTGSVGGHAEWLAGAPLATWADLHRLQVAGGMVGSHARHHVPLDTLETDAIERELVQSLADVRNHLDVSTPLLAYPHGRHDARVRAAAKRAGYALAYSTAQGRNGAGTDRWALHRVEPKMWDTTLSFGWKVITGKSPPWRWERLLVRQWTRRRGRATASDQRGG